MSEYHESTFSLQRQSKDSSNEVSKFRNTFKSDWLEFYPYHEDEIENLTDLFSEGRQTFI